MCAKWVCCNLCVYILFSWCLINTYRYINAFHGLRRHRDLLAIVHMLWKSTLRSIQRLSNLLAGLNVRNIEIQWFFVVFVVVGFLVISRVGAIIKKQTLFLHCRRRVFAIPNSLEFNHVNGLNHLLLFVKWWCCKVAMFSACFVIIFCTETFFC